MKKIIILMLFILPLMSFANDSIQGSAIFYGKELYLGEKIFLEIEVIAPKSVKIDLPENAPEIKGLESFGSPSPVEEIDKVQSKIYKKRYPYIAFDSVSGETGAIQIPYTDNGKGEVLNIQGSSFQVQRIPVDSTDALRAAYGPIPAVTAKDWSLFLWIAVAAIILGGLFAFLQWRKQRKKLSIPINADPREWALQQLDILEQQIPYVKQKDSWSQLTDIVRLYMERVWEVPAPYFSTGEVLSAIAGKQLYSSQIDTVAEVLEISDQVKFAKKISVEEEQRAAIQSAKEIIRYQPVNNFTVIKEEVGNG